MDVALSRELSSLVESVFALDAPLALIEDISTTIQAGFAQSIATLTRSGGTIGIHATAQLTTAGNQCMRKIARGYKDCTTAPIKYTSLTG